MARVMGQILAVFRKELIDGLRDRRSVVSALMFPLLGPVMIALVFNYVVSSNSQQDALELPVVGAAHAPGLIQYLEDQGVEIEEGPADPHAAVRDGDLDVVLVIPEGYGDRFRKARPARVQLVVDNSRNEARTSIRRTQRHLQTYASQVGALRLLTRGVDPKVAQAVAVQEVDLATPQKLAANILGMIPMFVLLSAFMGGMYLATDSTAGERERGSLEPLLINPVSRRRLVVGKWLATCVMGATSMTLTMVLMLLALQQVPLSEIGLEMTLGAADVVVILAVFAPMALLAAAVQLLVATFARSFKEAQTYLSLLVFVPMIPGMILSIRPMGSQLWMMFVPALGQQVLVTDIIRGEAVAGGWFVFSAVAALILTGVALVMTARLFERERIIYG